MWERLKQQASGTAGLSAEAKAGLEKLREQYRRERKKESKAPLEPAELDPVSRQLLEAAIREVTAAGEAPPELINHCERAYERERLIFSKIKAGGKERRNAFVIKRQRAKDKDKALVVATQPSRDIAGYRDLMMSRSICDWSKSAWVLPHPEVHTFELEPGEHMRVVLATDGLWDVLGNQATHGPADSRGHKRTVQDKFARAGQMAAVIARVYLRNSSCSETLLKKAIAEHKLASGRMDDDTTVMVVDLNLSGGAPQRVLWRDSVARFLYSVWTH